MGQHHSFELRLEFKSAQSTDQEFYDKEHYFTFRHSSKIGYVRSSKYSEGEIGLLSAYRSEEDPTDSQQSKVRKVGQLLEEMYPKKVVNSFREGFGVWVEMLHNFAQSALENICKERFYSFFLHLSNGSDCLINECPVFQFKETATVATTFLEHLHEFLVSLLLYDTTSRSCLIIAPFFDMYARELETFFKASLGKLEHAPNSLSSTTTTTKIEKILDRIKERGFYISFKGDDTLPWDIFSIALPLCFPIVCKDEEYVCSVTSWEECTYENWFERLLSAQEQTTLKEKWAKLVKVNELDFDPFTDDEGKAHIYLHYLPIAFGDFDPAKKYCVLGNDSDEDEIQDVVVKEDQIVFPYKSIPKKEWKCKAHKYFVFANELMSNKAQ